MSPTIAGLSHRPTLATRVATIAADYSRPVVAASFEKCERAGNFNLITRKKQSKLVTLLPSGTDLC